jgi:hypothetical protein
VAGLGFAVSEIARGGLSFTAGFEAAVVSLAGASGFCFEDVLVCLGCALPEAESLGLESGFF